MTTTAERESLDGSVPVRFPPDLAAAARRQAAAAGMTLSAWIRREVGRELARRSGHCPACGHDTAPPAESAG